MEADRAFIRQIFLEALDEHYSGDHFAHADRVLDAHLAGGRDQYGHFSLVQRMLILLDDNQPRGLVNVVHKRQGTVKISPLIVDRPARKQAGCGSLLLDAAREFATEVGARQLYCTVSETNAPALRFFRRKGFVVAGQAAGQYRVGVREALLYQSLTRPSPAAEAEGELTVRAVTDNDVADLERFLLEPMRTICDGLGSDWIRSLVDGHARRHLRDVNVRPGDVRVVVDRSGRLRGVAAASPKKGGSVKVMPLCATDPRALDQLLDVLPAELLAAGRRLYTHVPPDNMMVTALQRHGWSLEALLPGSHRDDSCMSQWSLELSEPRP